MTPETEFAIEPLTIAAVCIYAILAAVCIYAILTAVCVGLILYPRKQTHLADEEIAAGLDALRDQQRSRQLDKWNRDPEAQARRTDELAEMLSLVRRNRR